MSLQSGDKDHDAEIESSLRTSIKLNPSFAPSYDTLATFLASHQQKFDEAHLLNVQAVGLEPENLGYRLNAAYVLTQQGQYLSAIGVLKLALTVAKNQTQTEMVQSRIAQLEKIQVSIDRAKSPGVDTAPQSAAITSNAGKTLVFKKVDGKIMGVTEDTPNYPAGDATGPQHTIKGILRDIRCSYPTILALTIDQSGRKTALYTNNYYKVVFTTANYEPEGDIKPCIGIEDMKASVRYAEVSDKNVAGQILAIELSK
jgi:tetratricopeptide (TPR) repeat protein